MTIKYIDIQKDKVYIHHPLCTAIILLQGGQLISWLPKDTSDVLWATELSTYEKGKAFRGGIPICWPWFGKIKSPSHGFARLMTWKLEDSISTDENVVLNFSLKDTDETFKIFPYKFHLLLKMTLGLTCKIELFIDTKVETTGALHTYFRTDDILNEKISGLGEYYTDSLDSDKQKRSENTNLRINKEVDRIYTNPSEINKITNNNRTVKISHLNYSDIVVWNPWSNKVKQMDDMETNDYKYMLCIETAKINQRFEKNDYLAVEIGITNKNDGYK